MHPRRALLYTPGNDRHKIEKALTLAVDCLCMDMEDGVAPNCKSEARKGVVHAFDELDFGRSEKLARINSVGSGLETEDLQTMLTFHLDGVVVPKVENLEQLQWVSGKIEAAELECGWPLGSIRLLAGVETPGAILNLKEIASHPRLDALLFGGEDYAANIGAKRTAAALELLYARSALVAACAAFGLQAIDMVTIDFKDLDILRREASFGATLGYTGKQVIHPNQVVIVQEVFTPDEASIESARQLVQAFEANQSKGAGVFVRNGRMVELPHIKAARSVLERARAAGKIT